MVCSEVSTIRRQTTQLVICFQSIWSYSTWGIGGKQVQFKKGRIDPNPRIKSPLTGMNLSFRRMLFKDSQEIPLLGENLYEVNIFFLIFVPIINFFIVVVVIPHKYKIHY